MKTSDDIGVRVTVRSWDNWILFLVLTYKTLSVAQMGLVSVLAEASNPRIVTPTVCSMKPRKRAAKSRWKDT